MSKKEPVERFLQHVKIVGECWIWTGEHSANGYGRMWIHGRKAQAHRFAYEHFNGPIPDGMKVCHDCPGGDIPACVNPDHLWLGTTAENNRDSVAKGRHLPFDEWGRLKKPQRGERNPSAKLTPADVVAIRDRIAAGGTFRGVARELGVPRSTVFNVARRVTWRHI